MYFYYQAKKEKYLSAQSKRKKGRQKTKERNQPKESKEEELIKIKIHA